MYGYDNYYGYSSREAMYNAAKVREALNELDNENKKNRKEKKESEK